MGLSWVAALLVSVSLPRPTLRFWKLLKSSHRWHSKRAEGSIDKGWFALIEEKGRAAGGLLYNATKHFPVWRKIAVSEPVLDFGASLMGTDKVALVDINFRIELASRESIPVFVAPRLLVFNLFTEVACDMDSHFGCRGGDRGLELVSLQQSQGRILRVRKADAYHSYSDSILLDEPFVFLTLNSPEIAAGDLLGFRFDVLHRSRPNLSQDRCRWTLQLRWAAYDDPEFVNDRLPARYRDQGSDFILLEKTTSSVVIRDGYTL